MEVTSQPIWDLRPALTGINELAHDVVLWLPFMLLALMILAVASIVSWTTTWWSRRLLQRQIQAPLLREVAARVIGGTVLVLGLYVVLRVCGLSRLALTVVGGYPRLSGLQPCDFRSGHIVCKFIRVVQHKNRKTLLDRLNQQLTST